ncbi:DUF4163 domain-containing protein [Erythrobacter arachoides]|uniref:DUF4163 domain-containing protein n=1 Tax=Aurantiacibacter arachoides TaxID=1850444 RepID=A0A844ZYZ9_9SPHN|nr:DUF4163 domain-containing protein [Aurantiacibacter arachoides]MXO92462.1 DUF4163 domain-containing protein [Aurantiacibacter arachoides]GGD57002.1 hypothetical protein GCM10011411_16270 [Aurantiacibacter arachoides]
MMRRFSRIAVPGLLAAAATLSGCDMLAGGDPAPVATPTPSVSPTPAASPSEGPVDGAKQVREETDTFVFEYSWPTEAGEIPALAQWLQARLDRGREALATNARRGRDAARDNGFPFNQYSSDTRWTLVADVPGWLSMSAELSSYEGGAHGNYGFDAIVWDKTENVAREPVSFFTSAEALDSVLGKQLCEALNAERAERRGAPVAEGSDDPFDACVTPDETNVLLGSLRGEKFDTIGIQIAPYIAGPWAEGSYDFSFALDEDVLAIVRPEYRSAFAVRD